LRNNPFNELEVPDLAEAEVHRDETNRLLTELGRSGGSPREQPLVATSNLSVFADKDQEGLRDPTEPFPLWEVIERFADQVKPGDYLAFFLFFHPDPPTARKPAVVRRELGRRLKIATVRGKGPRYLRLRGRTHERCSDKGHFVVLTKGVD
jgi:hypothetical protein